MFSCNISRYNHRSFIAVLFRCCGLDKTAIGTTSSKHHLRSIKNLILYQGFAPSSCKKQNDSQQFLQLICNLSTNEDYVTVTGFRFLISFGLKQKTYMTFRIANTFTDSLAKLKDEEQKAVKTTAFDLQTNPVNPGIKFYGRSMDDTRMLQRASCVV